MMRILFLLLLLAAPAYAVIETYEFSDPALEERYQRLSAELRCPKCQNQNIADSNADISQDLRRLLYEQLEAGRSDAEILDYMVARYGDFVRYRPSFNGATAVLWLAPAVLLALAIGVVALSLRKRRGSEAAPAGLDAGEQRRLEQLLKEAERDQ